MFLVYLAIWVLAWVATWRGCVYYIEKNFSDEIKRQYADWMFWTVCILCVAVGVIITSILCKLFLTFSF